MWPRSRFHTGKSFSTQVSRSLPPPAKVGTAVISRGSLRELHSRIGIANPDGPVCTPVEHKPSPPFGRQPTVPLSRAVPVPGACGLAGARSPKFPIRIPRQPQHVHRRHICGEKSRILPARRGRAPKPASDRPIAEKAGTAHWRGAARQVAQPDRAPVTIPHSPRGDRRFSPVSLDDPVRQGMGPITGTVSLAGRTRDGATARLGLIARRWWRGSTPLALVTRRQLVHDAARGRLAPASGADR